MPAKKGKSARFSRLLRFREPKIYENIKKVMLLKGTNASLVTQELMKTIVSNNIK